MFRLRGHHLLCLLGYRGMGYSEGYVKNMTRIHQTLRTKPSSEILLVRGPDDLCEKFPDDLTCHCEDVNVHQRDAAVVSKLGLNIGQRSSWADIEERVRRCIMAEDISSLCESCSWRTYGVCAEGVEEVKNGKGLRVIE